LLREIPIPFLATYREPCVAVLKPVTYSTPFEPAVGIGDSIISFPTPFDFPGGLPFAGARLFFSIPVSLFHFLPSLLFPPP